MFYYHEAIFMPDFDFEIDFWQHIDGVVMSGHASMRQHIRVLPNPSLDFIRSGHIYECCIDKDGINYVCVRCSWVDDRDVIYIVGRDGCIITGWWVLKTKVQYPATKKRHYEEMLKSS